MRKFESLPRFVLLSLALLALVAFWRGGVLAADWPTWRHDAARGGATSEPLPNKLHLQWQRQFAQPRPAWPASQLEVQYDACYEPIVSGQTLLVGSNVDDSVTAFDTRSGRELWKFFTDGPVRFAPVVNDGRVYVASDDGHLYCLQLADGTMNWRVRGGPSERRVLGVERTISSWPLRGGPVVADGKVYFAAGIWPFMGIFLHAVDAATGETEWTNHEISSSFIVHPHGAQAFGSVVPQGYLAVSGDYLIVPGGRSLPAVFDRHTGKLVHFDFGGKTSGGFDVIATHDFVSTRGETIRLTDGKPLGTIPLSIARDDVLLGVTDTGSLSIRTAAGEIREVDSGTDRRGRRERGLAFVPADEWELNLPGGATVRPMLVAGERVFAATEKGITAYPWAKPTTSTENSQPSEIAPVWSAELDAPAWSVIAADDRLFVMTQEGRLHCYGAEQPPLTVHLAGIAALESKPGTAAASEASEMLTVAEMPGGYGLIAGRVSRELLDELLSQSSLKLVVLEPDAARLAALRADYSARGLYGTRISALGATPSLAALPPYFASLIVADLASGDFESDAARLSQSLRPYGGTMCLRFSENRHQAAIAIAQRELGQPTIAQQGNWTIVRRMGALPGAGSWTHQYADAANSVVSQDTLVKAPLGLLWFGGPSHDDVLPRHGHGPSPQVAGGRLIIEGPDMLRATDVYTGRELWKKPLPGLGKFYDNLSHQPGAGEVGSNYVTLADEIYVIYENEVLALAAATGEELRRFSVTDAGGERAPIGVLYAAGDLLVVTASPVAIDQKQKAKPAEGADLETALEAAAHAAASRRLVVFNRHTGDLLWSRAAEQAIRHNGLAVAQGKIFLIDGLSPKQLSALSRRGIKPTTPARLLALDATTGAELWSTSEDIFGTFLNYSVEHDILVQGGSAYRDRAQDEADRGLIAYRGADGSVLWKDLEVRYNGPCLLWRDKIITNGNGGFQIDLATGKANGWKFARMYGCNTILGSQNLLTFRSGAAGYCDLAGDSGTGNIGGFRSSCTSNLIVADGVLSAPEYTRTCNCAYQVQSSLALVEMPEAEMWTFRPSSAEPGSETRMGLNFGAPGDRRSPEGTIWFDYPSIGGPSPGLAVEVLPESAVYFQQHSTEISLAAAGSEEAKPKSAPREWIAASGVRGAERIRLTPPELLVPSATYTVCLHFAEPDLIVPGDRRFDIVLEGKTVASNFEIAAAAKGARRAIVTELPGVKIEGDLELELRPVEGAGLREPILCGLELIADAPHPQQTTSNE